MCGIFAYSGNKTDVAERILTGLKTLEYRGYDSWGIATTQADAAEILVDKHIGKIGEAVTHLPPSSLGIGHTRWATHGGVTDENAHPHLNAARTIAVAHNGIIENHKELRGTLIKMGYVFTSETDSEILAHHIDMLMKNEHMDFPQAVLACFNTITGSNALVALSAKSGTIVACRNGSPLVVGINKDELILASDVTAVMPYTKMVHYLLDGEAVVMQGSTCSLYSIKDSSKLPLTTERVEWDIENAQKNGHPHYMLKEILEQQSTTTKAVQQSLESIRTFAQAAVRAQSVVLTGCGTAYHCAQLGAYFFGRQGITARAIPANEFEAFSTTVNADTLIIAISQSGETADTLIAVKKAQSRGASVLALINARGSTLERLAQAYIPVATGPEIAVVSTKAFTAQSVTLAAIAAFCDPAATIDRFIALQRVLADWLTTDVQNQIMSVARTLIDAKDIYVIGKHIQFPAAMETALKIKEASYIHAEGFAAGELKHGVISLIEKGTPCIVLADADTQTDVLSSATELAARGGHIIGIAPFAASEFHTHIKTVEHDELTYVTNVIAGQLLGYYLSVGKGCDPDKPRNLAKSVTVK